MPLFEVAIIQTPTIEEREKGGGEKLILAPTSVVAKNREAAVMKASNKVKEEMNDQMEVLVRPFH